MVDPGPGCGPEPALGTVISAVPLLPSLVAVVVAAPAAFPVTVPLPLPALLTARDGSLGARAVLFISTETLLEPKLATARSGISSPLTSPTATDTEPLSAAKVCA